MNSSKRLILWLSLGLALLFWLGPNRCDPGPIQKSDIEKFQAMLADLDAAKTENQKLDVVDSFFKEIDYSGGFPIIAGDEVTFVYLQEYGVNAPISVAGDFNDWNPQTNIMTQSKNFYLFYGTVSIKNPLQRLKYKFAGSDSAGAELWLRDPMARRFQYDSFGEYSLIYGGADQSHLERYLNFHANQLNNDRNLYLYIPKGYYFDNADYPVLYMHDGQNLFDPEAFWGGWKADQVADQMIDQRKMEKIIMVGIANTPDRMDEYTQTKDLAMQGGDADQYADLVVNQIKPFIDGKYQTSPDRDHTAIIGSSLGGLISYYIGYYYPNIFAQVGGMSSTFGWGSIILNNTTLIQTFEAGSKQDIAYYLDCGGDDGGGCYDRDDDGVWDDNPDADDNYCETLQMKTVLQDKGYKEGQDLFYYYDPNAPHNEESWSNRLDVPFTAFFGR
jgi:predicted alpha/beta superfamily hydrolase